jgi:hypothetical protein
VREEVREADAVRVGVPLEAADTVLVTEGVPDAVVVPVFVGVPDGVIEVVRVPVEYDVGERVDEKDCVTEGVAACVAVDVPVVVVEMDDVREDDADRVPDLEPERVLEPLVVLLAVAVPVPVPVPVPVVLDVTVGVTV